MERQEDAEGDEERESIVTIGKEALAYSENKIYSYLSLFGLSKAGTM
jgi:hypothetical protein